MLNDIFHIKLPEAWFDWEILSLIGKGAYASVYKARNSAGDLSAIKIIECRGEAEASEAKILMDLSHAPGIVQIQDYHIENDFEELFPIPDSFNQNGEPAEGDSQSLGSLIRQPVQGSSNSSGSPGGFRLYIRMEYLTDLTTWAHDHPITEREAISMMMDLCTGLESCEKAGILHRDIKPENILVTEDGHARLCDFGVARMLSRTASSMTVQGTFAYMAPEVYHGRTYDHRADIYSLGLVFYQLMNGGVLPFMETVKPAASDSDNSSAPKVVKASINKVSVNSGSVHNGTNSSETDKKREEALHKRMKGQIFPRPSAASTSFTRILLKCCAFHPYNRFTSAAGLREALVHCQTKADRIGSSKGRSGGFLSGISHLFSVIWIRSGRLARLAAAVLLLMMVSAAAYGIWGRIPLIDHEPCGDGVVWTLYNNGTLVVSGHGIMSDLNFIGDQGQLINEDEVPEKQLLTYIDRVKKIIVKNGVRYVLFNYSLPELKEVVLSESVVCLGDRSFANCPRLAKVSFQGEDILLGNGAFLECTSLHEVNLPDHLTEIPQAFLGDCTGLEELTIPNSVRRIGDGAMYNTPWDKKLRERPGDYVKVNDILYAWNGEEKNPVISKDLGIRSIAYRAFSGRRIRSIVIDACVEDIGESAFTECKDLKRVVLPEGLKELKPHLFDGCSSLRDVSLPGSLEVIGDKAMAGCSALKELSIPPSVTRVGWQAFEGTLDEKQDKDGYKVIDGILISYAGEEKDLAIPEELGIRGIADNTFERQMQLERLQLPEGLEWVGEKACFMCNNLKDISLPASLNHVGRGAFIMTPWLDKQREKSSFVVINDMLIDYNGADSVLHIPDDLPVSRIMRSSIGSLELKEVYLPDQIRELEEGSFSECRSLSKVHFARTYSEEEIKKAFKGTPWLYMRQNTEADVKN